MKKLASLFLAAAMLLVLLSGCGNSNPGNSGNSDNEPGQTSDNEFRYVGPDGRTVAEEQTYRILYNGEVSTLNYLYSSSEVDLICGANCVETLVSSDQYGNLQPAAAESWTISDDGLTYTLNIRKGMKWYDNTGKEMADVTAYDWVTGALWVLDARNDSSNSHTLCAPLAGAQEYYDYTTALLNGETPAEVVSEESVGVKALDEYTLQYTLKSPRVSFLSQLEFGSYYPMSAACVEAYGSDLGTDNTKLWYCGAYLMDTFLPQQLHVYVKNDNYWDAENVHILRVERTYNAEAGTLAPTMFLNGEVDHADISSDLLAQWLSNADTSDKVTPTQVSTNYTYYWGFNFEPMFDEEYEPDNWRIAVNNENFRKSIYHGLDRLRALQVSRPNNASDLLNNSITPKNFVKSNTRDYTLYGDLAAYTEGDSFDEAKALEYKEKAIAELTAAGATFPVKILMQYNGDATWGKECVVIEQQLEGLLGTDYIDIIVNNYGSQSFLSGTRRCGNYAMQKLNGGCDYVDPETWIWMTDVGNNYTFATDTTDMFEKTTKSAETVAIVDEYLRLVDVARSETLDVDARYTAFANAEAYYLSHAMVIPYSATGGTYEATRLNPFEGTYSSAGWSYLRWKGMRVYEEPMSSEMYYTQLEAWETARNG